MSDLIWLIPAFAGVLILGYRILRAPYEMHVVVQRQLEAATKETPFPFAVTVAEASTGDSTIQLRTIVLNRQHDRPLALGLALRFADGDDGTQAWVSQAELGSFSLAVPAHATSDGVITFNHHRHKGVAHLVVFDMVSGRSTQAFRVPGMFPKGVRLHATTVSAFTKAPGEAVKFEMLLP